MLTTGVALIDHPTIYPQQNEIMASTDIGTVLSLAFRQLSDGLHQASVACKDLEYNIPLLLGKSDNVSTAKTSTTAQPAPPTEKTKRVRDPNEPRRPPSAYLLFTSKARAEVTKSEPELKPAEMMSKLAEMWKDLSNSEKQVSFYFSQADI